MHFDELLNNYIEQINCSSKELSDISGISAPVISRFRTGKKTPNLKSNQLEQLSNGLFLIASNKGIALKKEDIYSSLSKTLDDSVDVEQLRENFNLLVDTLNINISSLAYSMGFSASLISKIKSGQRNPYKPKLFADGVCRYIVNKFTNAEEKLAVAELINCNPSDIEGDISYYGRLSEWLSSDNSPVNNSIDNFFNNLNEFNLDAYIKSIHFDEMKVPHIPFYKASSKTYYGISEMRQGELDFFKAAVLSKSEDSIFMYSDMPMEDMAKDIDFAKKWMYAIAMTLKKGMHLDIIHNLNRPFKEVMLGIESWMPIYMTGQVAPYYMESTKDNMFCHLNYSAGSVALSGECIKGHHKSGKYNLYTGKADVVYYRKKSNLLLKKAKPLMEIYRLPDRNAFNSFIEKDARMEGNRRRILPSLPIHTISDELLLKILKRNKVPEKSISDIVRSVKEAKDLMSIILGNNNDVLDEIEFFSSEEEFNKTVPSLFVTNNFYENVISYNYSEYLEHFELTKKYSEAMSNYNLKLNKRHTFSNIQIYIHDKEFVMISKNTNPAIHFVIRHPKLRNAIENFVPPILE